MRRVKSIRRAPWQCKGESVGARSGRFQIQIFGSENHGPQAGECCPVVRGFLRARGESSPLRLSSVADAWHPARRHPSATPCRQLRPLRASRCPQTQVNSKVTCQLPVVTMAVTRPIVASENFPEWARQRRELALLYPGRERRESSRLSSARSLQ
ncbi:hypothetical protein chiPu_0010452 [Chiloscyllium punctatum]|uniref:Uncharacterized protein n=1 Tax=Chiloscyllium punctatum TaxID=137246 RepID=A0A401SNM4_CHIPU|nr:hypothetical protein [Chiloscyllium punctatum]